MSKKARPFRLFVNSFNAQGEKTWAVHIAGNVYWTLGDIVDCQVPTQWVFSPSRYVKKLQPFAWANGRGVVTRVGAGLRITSK